MAFFKEFKEFAFKGNVVDLAVAVIIGAAFGAIVASLVGDVITPLILKPALAAAGVNDISRLSWGAVKYGSLVAAVLNFVVIAFALFVLVKVVNRMKRKKEVQSGEAPSPQYTLTEQLLIDIRAALQKQAS